MKKYTIATEAIKHLWQQLSLARCEPLKSYFDDVKEPACYETATCGPNCEDGVKGGLRCAPGSEIDDGASHNSCNGGSCTYSGDFSSGEATCCKAKKTIDLDDDEDEQKLRYQPPSCDTGVSCGPTCGEAVEGGLECGPGSMFDKKALDMPCKGNTDTSPKGVTETTPKDVTDTAAETTAKVTECTYADDFSSGEATCCKPADGKSCDPRKVCGGGLCKCGPTCEDGAKGGLKCAAGSVPKSEMANKKCAAEECTFEADFKNADAKCCREFTLDELKDAAFTAKRLKDAGFTAAKLKEKSFTAAQLKEKGFTLDELRKAGFTTEQLGSSLGSDKKTCGEANDEGMDCAGGSVYDKRKKLTPCADHGDGHGNVCTSLDFADDAATCCTSLKALKEVSLKELTKYFTVDDLKKAGFTAEDLTEKGFKTCQHGKDTLSEMTNKDPKFYENVRKWLAGCKVKADEYCEGDCDPAKDFFNAKGENQHCCA